MSKELKIAKIKARINILKQRGETMNARIINKQERKLRLLSAE